MKTALENEAKTLFCLIMRRESVETRAIDGVKENALTAYPVGGWESASGRRVSPFSTEKLKKIALLSDNLSSKCQVQNPTQNKKRHLHEITSFRVSVVI